MEVFYRDQAVIALILAFLTLASRNLFIPGSLDVYDVGHRVTEHAQ
jgi:hypothetical protein